MRVAVELMLLFVLFLCLCYNIWDISDKATSYARRQLQERSNNSTNTSDSYTSSNKRKFIDPVHTKKEVDALVLYVFANADLQYFENLVYFVKHGVNEGDGVDYVIVIQQGNNTQELTKQLPKLPSNARYEYHTNRCFDWGTFGWLINTGRVDVKKYKYFAFMNSSVRGPFLPVYTKGYERWLDIFINKLNDDVKLSGPTISCEGAPKTDAFREWRRHPHVQSYLVVTDKVGIQVLIEDGMVFACHDDMRSAIYYSELGASRAILEAGYNLDSLMLRYKNINWREQYNWDCNMRVNPYNDHFYDGLSLHPFEVVFVKMKNHLVKQRYDTSFEASRYTVYNNQLKDSGQCEIISNLWKTDPGYWKLPKILFNQKRGSECFDHQYYKSKNQDVPQGLVKEQVFKHFVEYGQFEGRAHNFTCEFNMQGLI